MATQAPSTIVLITGANQGIGFETAKFLARDHPGYHIIMTGRNKSVVDAAAATLQSENLSVEPLHLDVTSDASIAAAVQHVTSTHGHLDVLINNAAVREGDGVNNRAEFKEVFDINVFGPAMVTDAFIPLLEKSTQTKRVVFLTTRLANFTYQEDPEWVPRNSFQWRTYVTSKPALNMLARQYAIKYEKDPSWKFNLTCPGKVSSNLTRYAPGSLPVETGAVNSVRLATLGPDGETGTFSSAEGGKIPW